MPQMIEPPNSLVLVVGRDKFTPPTSMDGAEFATTADCIAIGTVSVQDLPTWIGFQDSHEGLELLAEISIETQGEVSIRSVYNEVYEAASVDPGLVTVAIWTSGVPEPLEIMLELRSSE